ncbi:MAG TPA: 1-acyl-sn-glycerol-3-phosphate acyltransferase [Clostridiales bacterium]|nr:1-acyl-sn-glycerol-3-phosphate acyltransferase [Clostridiales bacterium]
MKKNISSDAEKHAMSIARQSTSLYAFGRAVCAPFMKLFFRTHYTNRYNLPEKGNYIICSNHISYLDPVFLGLGQKRRIRYMAKADLFDHPFFGSLISRLGAFPVHRGEGDMTAINVGEQILKDGGVMGIFFEGKRSRTGELLRPKSGAVMIAYQSNSPIVPACITPQKGLVRWFRKTQISFGEPITAQELGVIEGTPREFRNASKIIMEKVAKLREESKFD